MAFCNKCGSQLEPGDQFCQSCGNKISAGAAPNQSPGFTPNNTYTYQAPTGGNFRQASQFALYFVLLLAVIFVIGLTMMDRIGMILSAVLALIVTFGAFLPLRKGINGSASSILIGCAAAAALIGLYAVVTGGVLVGLLDIVSAGAGYMAWRYLSKR